MAKVTFSPEGKTTKLFPLLKKKVEDEYEKLDREKITPWVFINTGKPFHVEKCRGGEINWAGMNYDGAPKEVFWSAFIDPCLENTIIETFDYTLDLCRQSKLKPKRFLKEATSLLKMFVRAIFRRMAHVDRLLRGKGYPKEILERPVEKEVRYFDELIEAHCGAALAKGRGLSSRSRLGRLFENNKSIGIICAIIGALAGLVVIYSFFKN